MASRRQYLDQTELAEYADITITDSTEADDQISQAEEIIDAQAGFQDKFIECPIFGKAVSGSTTSLLLQSNQQNVYYRDYFVGCEVEIVGGTGKGQRKIISASTYDGTLTTQTFSVALDNTSLYKIYQLGKFPRCQDVYFDSVTGDLRYYKSIPENIKRAVAAQVQYMINMGNEFFSSLGYDSETIGDYSYSNSSATDSGEGYLIAPKAKLLLRGIVNRKGVMILE